MHFHVATLLLILPAVLGTTLPPEGSCGDLPEKVQLELYEIYRNMIVNLQTSCGDSIDAKMNVLYFMLLSYENLVVKFEKPCETTFNPLVFSSGCQPLIKTVAIYNETVVRIASRLGTFCQEKCKVPQQLVGVAKSLVNIVKESIRNHQM
ncbi:hypothetical protein L596_008923 [Steinernema carpocapsae]|uniref:Uncharacterized protein n=1 Tax=Steinernema carpocapsae TaxID=34508 RepID=A0A4U5PDX9_STECR|nr:hypothetical protein L596_008923 [Steinernema carpocapsae]